MIKLENIKVIFNEGTPLENIALRGLDLHIKDGDFITIIGGNGAGKSTLMNILAGAIHPNEGRILIDNQDLTKIPTKKRAADVSRVFQNPSNGTCCDLTLEENLALAYSRGKKRGLKIAINEETKKKFRNSLKELRIGLEDRLKDPIKMLSGGQRQAVSLLMATLIGSKILLLDEHTAALDPKMAKTIMNLTEKLIQKHKLTALMITHSMQLAFDYGNRTIVMQEGKTVKEVEGAERAALETRRLGKNFRNLVVLPG